VTILEVLRSSPEPPSASHRSWYRRLNELSTSHDPLDVARLARDLNGRADSPALLRMAVSARRRLIPPVAAEAGVDDSEAAMLIESALSGS